MNHPHKILIIEDDPHVADLVEIHLKDWGCDLERAAEGASGLRHALQESYDLIILDLMLPGMDGLTVCKRIRAENALVPILMLTSKAEELDKVLGLELGADDYLTKPFSVRELMARIKALLRRHEVEQETVAKQTAAKELAYDDLKVYLDKRKATLAGRALELTAKEFDLLVLFASHPGRAYSRSDLLDLVWGHQFAGYEHTVNSHINRLRSKIEKDPSQPKYIQTVWGIGYRFAELEGEAE
jgi:DNA-binding response OmpR family regulator